MDSIEFKTALWDRLMELPVRKKHNSQQLSIRCPFCGDSRKNPKSTHFYIKINFKEDEPVVFNCFKCDTSGIMNPSVLRTIGINDLDINSSLLSYNKKAMRGMKRQLGVTDNNFNFKIPVADPNNERNIVKKDYLDERLGIKTTFEELANLRVIFRFIDFLKINEIDTITTSKQKAIMLNNDYMGFLTTRQEFINFRQVYTENKGKRYEKYSIFSNIDNTRKFYTIPNEVDLLSPKKFTINIAEGVFDILGIYYHIYEKENKNMIYTAACGSGFTSVIKYFIKMGVFNNVDINIFSDEDHPPAFYKKLVKEIQPWVDTINLYYNERYKDYGVAKNKIKIIRKKI